MIVRAATRADAEAMARVHWLSSNAAYGRNDDLERRLAAAHRLFDLECAHAELAQTCDVATLTCLPGNARARRFYERNGWELGERVTEPHFGGEPTEVVRYRKRFGSSSARSPS